MHPAPSVILFTVLSGLGFGFLACLNLGLIQPQGLGGFVAFAIGYAFAVSGLIASTFHLGHPERALRAFTEGLAPVTIATLPSRRNSLLVKSAMFPAPYLGKIGAPTPTVTVL